MQFVSSDQARMLLRSGLGVFTAFVLRLLLYLQMVTMSEFRSHQYSLNDYGTLAELLALSPHSKKVQTEVKSVECSCRFHALVSFHPEKCLLCQDQTILFFCLLQQSQKWMPIPPHCVLPVLRSVLSKNNKMHIWSYYKRNMLMFNVIIIVLFTIIFTVNIVMCISHSCK